MPKEKNKAEGASGLRKEHIAGGLIVLAVLFFSVLGIGHRDFIASRKTLSRPGHPKNQAGAKEIKIRNDAIGIRITKNRHLRQHLVRNLDRLMAEYGSIRDNVNEYMTTYKEAEMTIISMRRDRILSRGQKKELLGDLKSANFQKLTNRLEYINLNKMSGGDVMARKFYLLGMVAELNFNYHSALDNYEKAIKINSYNPSYYNRLGSLEIRLEMFFPAIENLRMAVGLATNSNELQIKTVALQNLASAHYAAGDGAGAFMNYTESLAMPKRYRNAHTDWKNYVGMGNVSMRRINFDGALIYYGHALKKARTMENDYAIASTLNMISRTNYNYGDYVNGMRAAKKAMKLAKKNVDLDVMADSLYYMCLNSEYLGEREAAVEYCRQSVLIRLSLGKMLGSPTQFMSAAKTMDFVASVRNTDDALKYAQIAHNIYEANGSEMGKIAVIKLMGNIYTSMGRYRESLNNFETQSLMLRHRGLRNFQSENFGNIAFVNWLTGDLQTAEKNLRLAIKMNDNGIDSPESWVLHSHLASVLTELKNYREAENECSRAMGMAKAALRPDHHYIRYLESQCEGIRLKTKEDLDCPTGGMGPAGGGMHRGSNRGRGIGRRQ